MVLWLVLTGWEVSSFPCGFVFQRVRPGMFALAAMDRPGDAAAQGFMNSLMLIEGRLGSDPGLGLGYDLLGRAIASLVFQAAPESFNKDIVNEAAIAANADFYFVVYQPVGEGFTAN